MIGSRAAIQAIVEQVEPAVLKIATDVTGDAGAVFSNCESYRYLLWRIWNPDLPLWSFGMLNPSTADHLQLDPTVDRCQTRANAGGAGGLIIWNLFAWRATDPAAMKRVADPVGAFNDDAMLAAVAASAMNIAAWGSHGTHRDREHRVRAALNGAGAALHALSFTAAGLPRHPLYLPLALEPQPWKFTP